MSSASLLMMPCGLRCAPSPAMAPEVADECPLQLQPLLDFPTERRERKEERMAVAGQPVFCTLLVGHGCCCSCSLAYCFSQSSRRGLWLIHVRLMLMVLSMPRSA